MATGATRHRAKIRSPERQLHIAVEAFLRVAWPPHLPYTHFPAGEMRDRKTATNRDGSPVLDRKGKPKTYSPAAAKLKAMGLKPGWPDFQFILPNGQAAFIELKTGRSELSDDQVELRRKLVALKCGYATARSVDEVEATLSKWLGLFGQRLAARSVVRPTAPTAHQVAP